MTFNRSTTLLDFIYRKTSEAPVEAPRRRSGGVFQEYVEAVLKVKGAEGQRVLTRILRDRGPGNFYRKFLELKRTGPLESEFPRPVVERDQRD